MRSLSSVRLAGSLLLCGCLLVPVARGEPTCGRAGKPWVALAFKGDAWSPQLRAEVLADLRAELALQGFEACPLGNRGSQPPLALIEISAEQADRVRVVIGVHDAITEKRVVRDVDLADVAEDGRGLTVAVAADELLRASWAELTLDDAPEPAMEPPPEVDRTLRASIAPRFAGGGAGGQRLGVRFATEHHTGGQTWLGGDALLGLWFHPRWGTELSVGARDGVAVDADLGRVDSTALLGTAGLRFALLRRGGPFELSAGLGLSAASVQLTAEADAGNRARNGAAFGLGAHASGSAGVLLGGPLELRVDLDLGLPLREVEAVDERDAISSTGGLSVRAGVGLGVRL